MVNDLECKMRCLELAAQIQFRAQDMNVENIVDVYKRLYYPVFVEAASASTLSLGDKVKNVSTDAPKKVSVQ